MKLIPTRSAHLRRVVVEATTLKEAVRIPEVEFALSKWLENVAEDNRGVLIGGIAASLYMRPRYTEDIYLLFLDDSALLDAIPTGFKKIRPHALRENKTHVEVELTTPKIFSNLSVQIAAKVIATARNLQGLKVASIQGVIALKLSAARERDKADIVDILKQNPDVNFNGWPLTAQHIQLLDDLRAKAKAELTGGIFHDYSNKG